MESAEPVVVRFSSESILPVNRVQALRALDHLVEVCRELYRRCGGGVLELVDFTVDKNQSDAIMVFQPDDREAGEALGVRLEEAFRVAQNAIDGEKSDERN